MLILKLFIVLRKPFDDQYRSNRVVLKEIDKMNLSNHRKSQLKNWFSIYGLLFFLCLPIWNTVSNIYNYDNGELVELQEQIEEETEDTTTEENHTKQYNPTVSHQYSIIKNISIVATSVNYFELNNIASDVVTPPPERC